MNLPESLEVFTKLLLFLAIALGVVECFWGYRFWGFILGLFGFGVGFAVGAVLSVIALPREPGFALFGGLLGAAGLAALFYNFRSFGGFIFGWATGIALVVSVGVLFLQMGRGYPSQDAVVGLLLVSVFLGLFMGFLPTGNNRNGIITVSAIAGAQGLVGIGWALLDSGGGHSWQSAFIRDPHGSLASSFAQLLLTGICAGIGAAVQLQTAEGSRASVARLGHDAVDAVGDGLRRAKQKLASVPAAHVPVPKTHYPEPIRPVPAQPAQPAQSVQADDDSTEIRVSPRGIAGLEAFEDRTVRCLPGYLELVEGGKPGTIPLAGGNVVTIGRVHREGKGISFIGLEDPGKMLGRKQFLIKYNATGSQFTIENQGTNPTVVAGITMQPGQQKLISDGTDIRVPGGYAFRFHTGQHWQRKA